MTHVFTRYSSGVLLAAFVFVQLVLLGYQVRTDQDMSLLRYWVVSAMTPVEKGMQGISGSASGAWNRYFWLVDKAETNRELEAEAARLNLENQWLRQSLRRFDREAELVAYQQELASKTVLARVIAGGSSPSSKEVFLDRGEEHGIRSGMAVITADGIVGQVLASYPSASLVLLINDAESGAGIVLDHSRARGVLKGAGTRICKIDYISPETKVSVGELVYTSGDDRVFPRGLLVGKVTRVSKGISFQNISVEPAAPLERLEEALIVAVGVHLDLPSDAVPTAPEVLMSPPRLWTRRSGDVESGSIGGNTSASNQTPAAGLLEASGITTDADRIKERYRRVVAAQGTRVGSISLAVPPPDFNFDPDAPPLVDPEAELSGENLEDPEQPEQAGEQP